MKIKRYLAGSMRVALAQVRAEQGPDAVILSSRRVDEGIEVIAAVDYDEALFVGAIRQRPAPTQPEAAPEPAPAPRRTEGMRPPTIAPAAAATAVPSVTATPAVKPAATPAANPAALPPSAPGVAPTRRPAPPSRSVSPSGPTAEPGLFAVRRELSDLRSMLESELATLSWHDKRAREPLKARVLEELSSYDIAPDIARGLAALTPRRTNMVDPAHLPLALLVKYLPVVEQSQMTNPGVVALVGPTGAGKTTTIAKLAARWSMRHGSQDLALVSTDCYRIGAREQLMTYARLLGAPMHVANNGAELGKVLQRLRAKKLILIDTAGMGPRDARLAEQLAALQLGATRAHVLLTLPAQAEGRALDEIVRAFAQATPAACVLTKVDEAASLGGVLSVAMRHSLKIAYLCDGQRVPEDMHSAYRRRVWLARNATRLKSNLPPGGNEAYLARHFGRAHAHG